MAATRRPAEVSKLMLIEAAVAVIREEGYGALSAKRLAEKVGLKRQIIHYYFGTTDELLLAVVRHYGEAGLNRFSEAFARRDPLRVIWETDPDSSATTFAFMAMATHNPAVRGEMRKYLDAMRELQIKAIARHFADLGVRPEITPRTLAIALQSIAQSLAAEEALGATVGHAHTRRQVEQAMVALSSPKKRARRKRKAS